MSPISYLNSHSSITYRAQLRAIAMKLLSRRRTLVFCGSLSLDRRNANIYRKLKRFSRAGTVFE